MPIYTYKCQLCGHEFDEMRKISERGLVAICKCNCPAPRVLRFTTSKDWFRPHWNEDLSVDGPIYVESKKHYKRLCKEHGVMARCLM